MTFSHLSAGNNFTCGLKTDGGLYCWGSGISGTPAGTGYKAMDAGYAHACAIASDDTLTCWGDSSNGRTEAPTGIFSSLSAGGDHTCAIRTDGFMQCWGANASGQAPQISILPDNLPDLDVGQSFNQALAVSGGRVSEYSFSGTPPPGIDLDPSLGTLSGEASQPGNFDYTIRVVERNLTPALARDKSYSQIVRSQSAISIDAVTPSAPMVGEPVRVDFTVSETPGDYFTPEPTLTVTVSAAGGQSCQFNMTDGSGSCYLFFTSTGDKSISASYAGDENFMPTSTSAPTMVSVSPFVQEPKVHTGQDRTFVHKADGTLRCVGANCNQLSLTTVYPVVGVGDGLACALRTDGQVLCRKDNQAADIYPGQFKDLSVGRAHVCAIDVHGAIHC
jgi:hypothetical protein